MIINDLITKISRVNRIHRIINADLFELTYNDYFFIIRKNGEMISSNRFLEYYEILVSNANNI